MTQHSTTSSPPQFSSVYCLKALGAFFVICIHCYEPWYIFPITRTAVPFFFIISGFFLYRDNSTEALGKCVKAFKKTFWITLYANLFYYICYFVPANILPFPGLKSAVGYITIGEKFGFHLWYLTAYLETLSVFIIALKFRLSRLLWCLMAVGMMLGLLVGKYALLFPDLPHGIILSRNFFTMGIPCFGIGWLMKKHSCQLINIFSSPLLFTGFLLLLSVCEIVILRYTISFACGDYLITTFPLAAAMMLSAVKYPSVGKNSIIEFVGKNYATYIYIFHVFILRMFSSLNAKLLHFPSLAVPFIVYITTIVFIFVWRKCSLKFFN